jgi:hypothetical protein
MQLTPFFLANSELSTSFRKIVINEPELCMLIAWIDIIRHPLLITNTVSYIDKAAIKIASSRTKDIKVQNSK